MKISRTGEVLSRIFPKESVVVLDIGRRFIKAAILKKREEGLKLRKIDLIPLPLANAEEGTPDAEAVLPAIKAYLEQNKISLARIVTALSDEAVILKTIELPPAESEQIEKMLPFQIEQYVPYALERINYDFHLLASSPEKNELLLAVVRKAVLSRELAIFKDLNLTLETVEVDCLANFNASRDEVKKDASPVRDTTGAGRKEISNGVKVAAFLEMGTERCSVVIARGDRIEATATITVGGDDFTRGLADHLRLNFAEAEKFKVTGREEAEEKKQEVIEKISAELKEVFEYFRGQSRGERPELIIFSGGGAKLTGLAKALEKRVGVPVMVADPLAGVSDEVAGGELKKNSPQFSVLRGMVKRLQEEVPIKVNLVSGEYTRLEKSARRKKELTSRVTRGAGAVLVVIVLVFVFQYLLFRINSVRYLNRATALEPLVGKVQAMEKEIENLEKGMETIRNLEKENISWLEIMKALSESLPEELWFTRINFERGGKITLDGQAASLELITTHLKDALEESGYFTDIDIPRTTTSSPRGRETITFQLTAQVNPVRKSPRSATIPFLEETSNGVKRTGGEE